MPEVTLKSWIMVLTLGCVWGGSFLLIEIALRGISPFWLAEARLLFAAILLTAVWGALGGKVTPVKDGKNRWPYLVVVGLFSSAFPFFLLSWGQQHVTSATAGVSMAGVPLLVMPLAHFFSVGERITVMKLVGLLVGFCGVLALLGDGLMQSSGSGLEGWGRVACLSAAACYAISSVTTRNCPPIDAYAMSAVVMIIAAIAGLPVAWLKEGPPPLPDLTTLAVLSGLGLIQTAGANLLRILVIRSAGSTFMSLTNYQVPFWSMVFGALILGEALPAGLFLALALILTGMALSQWSHLRRLFGKA
ncbi:MAG: DMT family transporter [Donghicola eburneus]|nr:DMT family transporter [Donghicola eburneus]MCI5039099.1 DMT family transporter [Donghicola eburneus]